MNPTRNKLNAPDDPHAGQPIRAVGPAPEDAKATLLLIHGRGAYADSILSLHESLGLAEVAFLAPQAYGNTWYPQSFLAPLDANQPYLDSALAKIDAVVTNLLSRGVPSERIAILGFSQGACLTTEYVARRPRRYGAVMGLTGALIGPPGTTRSYPGSLAGTPVFLGTSDPDSHVPFERVRETEKVLAAMGAKVEFRRYAGMSHMINEDELVVCRRLLRAVVASPVEGKP
ncbi:MAG TPA: dienelactone hydrolase family protein [Tepidisphaeraceae bacterium]|jgi:predicted esterase